MRIDTSRNNAVGLLSSIVMDVIVIGMFLVGALSNLSQNVQDGLFISYLSLGIFPVALFLLSPILYRGKSTSSAQISEEDRAKRIIGIPVWIFFTLIAGFALYQFFQEYFSTTALIIFIVLFAQYSLTKIVFEKKWTIMDLMYYGFALLLLVNVVPAWGSWYEHALFVITFFAIIRLYHDVIFFLSWYYSCDDVKIIPLVTMLFTILLLVPIFGLAGAVYVLIVIHMFFLGLSVRASRKRANKDMSIV